MRTNRFNRILSISISLIVMCGLAMAQETKQIDERIWSMSYWLKLAEEGVITFTPADKTSLQTRPQIPDSRIHAKSVLTDDSPDVRVTPLTNVTQSEVSVFINPNDDTKLLNSNNSSDLPVTTIFGASYFLSDDGGLTWTGSPQGAGGTNRGDPATGIDLNGRYYIGYIAPNDGQGCAYSTNEGQSWTAVQVANPSGDLLDKNHLWVDHNPSSPYANNVYSAWTDFASANTDVFLARSMDGGLTWSSPVNVSQGLALDFNQGVNIQTGPNGEVYVAWVIYDSFPSDDKAIGFAKSLDGGATFSTSVRAIDNIRGLRSTGLGGGKTMRVSSFPSMTVNQNNGTIYIVWPNIGVPGVNSGDPDIYMIKSGDGGTTWSTPSRINTDPIGNGKDQWYPWIACDPSTGFLVCIFYDSRNFAGNDQAETWVAASTDNGNSWEDFKVSDVPWTGDGFSGFASNYAGDYIGIDILNGKVYPMWMDVRGGQLMTWVSPFLLADPTDPNPPSEFEAYSDYTTPTSMALSWTDPTTLANGDTLLPSDFQIHILRDDVAIDSVAGGTEQYTDMGLTDGVQYTYTLFTKVLANDSTSLGVNATWHAGGSPTPSAPDNLVLTADTSQAVLTWNDPTTQNDGTPLDDLDSLLVYRDGVHIASLSPGVETYTDSPPPGFVYTYTVKAKDNESPANLSGPSNEASGFVGTTPDYLVWVGPDAMGSSASSGDSIYEALLANGESTFLTNDLFEFGPDLSIYEAVFVVLGIFSNNHVIGASDPEGAALETYLAGGGRIYLEGGDCFNYDPDFGGYNIRPWFDLDNGDDGSGDLSGVNGINDLSAFSFAYNGENNYMDELVPIASTPVWQNNANTDISGVFNTGFGSGRSIGVVPSFGGLIDNSAPLYTGERIVKGAARKSAEAHAFKSRPARTKQAEFVKKAAYYPERKALRKDNRQLFKVTAAGVRILANTKEDLMAAYIGLFHATGVPQISVNPATFADTLLVGATSAQTMTVSNSGGSLAGELYFTVTENPQVDWLTPSVVSDTLLGNQSSLITLTFDASGLSIGDYSTTLEVASNDTANPLIQVPVTLRANGAPVVGFSPDSLTFTLAPGQSDTLTLNISNSGQGPLNFSLTDQDVYNAKRTKNNRQTKRYPDSYYGQQFGKGELDSRHGIPPTEGLGGPDNFGYRWIDSDEPGGPVFNWVDISATGTPLTSTSNWIPSGTFGGNDEGYIAIPLPFTFTYYGMPYNSAYVGSNGTLSFQAPTGNYYTNQPVPTAGDALDNFLGAFWDDLEVNDPAVIYYGMQGNDFVVQFVDMTRYFSSSPDYTYEYILKPTGAILFQYLQMGISGGSVNTSTVGFENADGTDGLEIVYNADYLHNNLAILIAAESIWLSQNPASGIVAAGDSASVQVIADATFLTEGTYRAKIIIASNDPVNPLVNVGVHLDVGTCTPGFLGDITGDDLVNSTDGLVALSYDAGLPVPQAFLDRIAIGFGDPNEDGMTTSTDGLIILSYDGGIPVPFPVGDPVCLPDGSKRTASKSVVPQKGKSVLVSAAPAVKQIAPGSTFKIPVMVDVSKAGDLLGSYTATLEWNPDVFQFVGYSGGSTEGFENPVVNDKAVEEGRMTFAHAYPYGAEGQVNILNVRMKSIGKEGTEGSLSLSFSAMAAAKTFTDLLPYVINAEEDVTVDKIAYGISNYPNPFNPTTDIKYGLAEAGDVQIVIYNVLGQKVKTLVDGRKEAGNYVIRWNGTNEYGQSLPSGMYFLRMQAGKFRADRKLLFLK